MRSFSLARGFKRFFMFGRHGWRHAAPPVFAPPGKIAQIFAAIS